MSNSLEYACEEVAIQLLGQQSALLDLQNKIVHFDENNELELPAIIVHAVVQGEHTSHPTNPLMRTYNVLVEVELRGVISQTAALTFDGYFQAIEEAFKSPSQNIDAFSNFNFFAIDSNDGNDRTIEEDRRHRMRKFKFIVQLKSA